MAERGVRMRADGVNRADQGLRDFARREGDAVFCRKCDGDGVVLRSIISSPEAKRRDQKEPVKCTRCGGEGAGAAGVTRAQLLASASSCATQRVLEPRDLPIYVWAPDRVWP